jgi:hypothetical protein
MTPVPVFDRLTRRAANLSAILLAGALIGLHPDMTRTLQVLCTVALVVGWLGAGAARPWMIGVWIAAGILAPAPLRLLAGREGPVLDVFWMAGLTASLLRVAAWSHWSLDPWTRLCAGGWVVTLVLGVPVLAARELAFDPRLMFDFGAVNSWTGWTAAHVVAWMGFVAWGHLLGVIWLDWATVRFASFSARPARILHPFWIATTIASLVAIFQGVVDLSFLNPPFWAERLRASGTLLDANAYGVCAALAALTAVVTSHGGGWTRWAALAVAVNLAGLGMSGSRTGLICGVVTVLAIGAAIWRSGNRGRLLAIASGAAAIVAVVVATSDATGPLKRLFERPAGTDDSFVAVVFTRPPYGHIAGEMIRDYPLTGVGIGAYQQLAADYWRRESDDMLAFDNAQNWWRHELSELGVLGALPLVLWSALLAWQVLLGRSRRERLFEAWLVRGALLAVGVGSITQMPTQAPVILLWFLTFVAWLPQLLQKLPLANIRVSSTVAIVLAVAYAAGHLVLARGSLSVAERAKTFGHEYVSGAYGAEPLEGSGTFRWTDDESRFVWPLRTRWFVIRVWAHHPDVSVEPVKVTITTPCGTLLDRTLANSDQLSIGVIVPEGLKSLDATVRVSRTWQPSSFGEPDSRRLGVGITADSVDSQALAESTHVPVKLEDTCDR